MAARWMEAKIAKLKPQIVASAQAELTKACYFTSKPEVPAYDPAMVKRVNVQTKPVERLANGLVKRRYTTASKTLVQSGIGTIGSWETTGTQRLIKRA